MNNCQSEENKNRDWRPMVIAWEASESFAPALVSRQVGVRLLLWNGSDAKWVSPFLKGSDGSASWTGSLNFTADAQ
jgi:hypothetical protein